jgi:hypothetical protein
MGQEPHRSQDAPQLDTERVLPPSSVKPLVVLGGLECLIMDGSTRRSG